MTNYDGIIRMTPDELEAFLEQVHLRGLITGGYAVRMGFNWELEANPFNAAWLAEEAEKAVEDIIGAPYLNALSRAIGMLLVGAAREKKPPVLLQIKYTDRAGKDLWDQWVTQDLRLMECQAGVFSVLEQMEAAIRKGEVTDPDEIDDILLELSVFADHYPQAKALWQEVYNQIVRHHPAFWRDGGSGLVRAIYEEYEKGVNMNDN